MMVMGIITMITIMRLVIIIEIGDCYLTQEKQGKT